MNRRLSMAGLPNGKTRLLGILGRPLDHSLSPSLHSAVLREMDRNLLYLPLPVPEARLERFLEEAPGLGIVGLNVTTPYKRLVAEWVRPRDRETARTGVVNTIGFDRRGAWGAGTDGAGILGYLSWLGLGDEPVGLLGFGATGRSFTHRVWADGKAPLLIVTRRRGDVEGDLERWKGKGLDPKRIPGVVAWTHLAAAALPRIWVSALPPERGAIPRRFWTALPRRSVLLDLNYGEGRTVHLQVARAHGLRGADGLGPLLHQAALSLSLWLQEEVPAARFFRASGASRARLSPSSSPS